MILDDVNSFFRKQHDRTKNKREHASGLFGSSATKNRLYDGNEMLDDLNSKRYNRLQGWV